MPGETVHVEGLREVRMALRKAGEDMGELKDAHEAVSRLVAAAAAALAPHRSGRLAGSIRPSRQQARARVSSRLVYAGVIHWGWPAHHIAPQPFAVRAATQTRPQWQATYEQDLRKIAATAERVTRG